MGRSLRFPRSSLLLLVLVSVAAAALQVPAGTGIQIRLKTKVSTQTSKAKDAVEAVVIAPVMVNNQFAIPAGAIVRGTVDKVTQSTKPDERSLLVLKFTEIEISGTKLKLAAQLSGVENARESVDDQGQINGIIAADTISGRLDTQLDKLGEKYASFADILTAAKKAVIQSTESDITYDTGVEMDLKLTAPLALDKPSGPGPAASLQPIPNLDALAAMAAKQPFQTMAESPSKPSDVTNLMVIGSEEQVKQAFSDAGWSSAAALSAESKLQTVQAVAEQRGYKEAPVSVLLLDGKPPDLVFEKLNNTFAMRHHLRVWRQPATFDGKAVWVISATHDTGIDFSAENRTFIHKIDSQIDRERAKVVNDLLFTGKVSGMALVDRPDVPTHSQNATGDDLDTDGKIAVLLLK